MTKRNIKDRTTIDKNKKRPRNLEAMLVSTSTYFTNDYKTMYPWFMESVWWVFKQLYLKGLVYQGNKVMPYSTKCNTPLSNFESGQNYKDVIDPAITVSLPLINDENDASLLVWTTTPWTLPSNLAACANPDLTYARFQQISSGNIYIMLESRIETIFQAGDFKVLRTFPGRDLKGLHYEPVFHYFKHLQDKAFVVLVDGYVTDDTGTGIVHQAPYFGEDDYRVCLANNVITKDQDPICPIDPSGCFLPPVVDFLGQYVKDADALIISKLKDKGRLVHQSQVKHSYPFCWRSDTPLIYRAVPSWFIRVEHMQEALLKSAMDTYWVPDFIKEKRFGNWLREARDWAISRNRYWGTPIPIWISPDGEEIRCIGSIGELEEAIGGKVSDLHRENIDDLEIPSRILGNPPLKRIPEVFDCWFESGCMPYAQCHYPFENAEFNEQFPADFIAEGIDQTRGWFYTLVVVSTALFGKAPFKNLIANGLVLANDGQKMSKSKKNFPDPLYVVEKYGADALRLYLINSPVVRAENLRFKEEGVRGVVKDVLLPWYNAFRFLMQNIAIYVQENKQFLYSEKNIVHTNVMDRWILSFTQSLLAYTKREMELCHLYNVVPRLTRYIDSLTNWYLRMNRKRLKGDDGLEDCTSALMALFNVLLIITKMMAPFAPFMSEYVYQHLKDLCTSESGSVHYVMLPEPNQALIDAGIERAVARMQSVIELGRIMRDRRTIPVKYPLPELLVIHQDAQYLADIVSLSEYIKLELNVRRIITSGDKGRFGVTFQVVPEYKILGSRLKQDIKAITSALKALTDEEIDNMRTRGYVDIGVHRIIADEVRLICKLDKLDNDRYEVNSDNDVLAILEVMPDSSMQDEGVAREIVNRIQKLRKKAHLVPTDQVLVFYSCKGDLERIAMNYTEFIEAAVKTSFQSVALCNADENIIVEDTVAVKGFDMYIALTRRSNVQLPIVKWANVEVIGKKTHYCNMATKGLVLLEVANRLINLEGLTKVIEQLFGISNFNLWTRDGEITTSDEIATLHAKTVFVRPAEEKGVEFPQDSGVPFCKVVNFEEGGVSGTVILENPTGNSVAGNMGDIVSTWIELSRL